MMSRMLKALQQVGATSESDHQPRPLTREELRAFGLWHLLDPQQAEPSPDGATPAAETENPEGRRISAPRPAEYRTSQPTADLLGSCETALRAISSLVPQSESEPLLKQAAPSKVAAPEGIFAEQTGPLQPGKTDSPVLPFQTGGFESCNHRMGVPLSAYPQDRGLLTEKPVRQRQQDYEELASRILSDIPHGLPAVLSLVGVDCDGAVAEMMIRLAMAVTDRLTQNVVVVDADFQRPLLTNLLGIETQRTLIDVLLGGIPWTDAIVQTEQPRLSVLPGGRLLPADQQLLDARQSGRLLDQLRKDHQLVLVNAGGAPDSDPVTLADDSDGIYVVVELERTSRRAARQAIGRLDRLKPRLLGCIAMAVTGKTVFRQD